MALSTANQPVIVCSDCVSDQADISAKLAMHYDDIFACQLVQLEPMIERDTSSIVVVSWHQPTAELRLIVELCKDKQVPLVVIIKQLNSIDINRLPESNDFVILPFDSAFDLKPWIDHSIQVREKSIAMQHQMQQLISKLEERKWIEKAKGLLMKMHQLDEDNAYRVLRTSAMQSSLSLGQVARNIIHTVDSINIK